MFDIRYKQVHDIYKTPAGVHIPRLVLSAVILVVLRNPRENDFEPAFLDGKAARPRIIGVLLLGSDGPRQVRHCRKRTDGTRTRSILGTEMSVDKRQNDIGGGGGVAIEDVAVVDARLRVIPCSSYLVLPYYRQQDNFRDT